MCRGEKVLNRVNEVQQLGSVDLPHLGYVGAKCDDEHISAQIDVPYSGHNGENCADEQISAQIDVPYSGHNGVNCADEQISAQIDVPFLGYVGATCDAENWSAEIEVNGHDTKFKLDTGAGVSVVSDRETWLQSENLLTTKQTLRGPGGTLLPVMGVINARLRHRNKSLDELVYVIRNQEYSLLRRRACVGLDLVARVDNVQENMSDKPNFRAEFWSLFKGNGKLKTEHHITICADATPVCLYTARKIAHPLLPQIKSEIESMVREEIISPVTVPTPCCSGMVPVQKENGTVRICVDLTHLNKSVQREVHSMSSVDESLAKLGNSKVFSKLDANSGFWQLPLDDESRL